MAELAEMLSAFGYAWSWVKQACGFAGVNNQSAACLPDADPPQVQSWSPQPQARVQAPRARPSRPGYAPLPLHRESARQALGSGRHNGGQVRGQIQPEGAALQPIHTAVEDAIEDIDAPGRPPPSKRRRLSVQTDGPQKQSAPTGHTRQGISYAAHYSSRRQGARPPKRGADMYEMPEGLAMNRHGHFTVKVPPCTKFFNRDDHPAALSCVRFLQAAKKKAQGKAPGQNSRPRRLNKAYLNRVHQAVEDALQQWELENGQPDEDIPTSSSDGNESYKTSSDGNYGSSSDLSQEPLGPQESIQHDEALDLPASPRPDAAGRASWMLSRERQSAAEGESSMHSSELAAEVVGVLGYAPVCNEAGAGPPHSPAPSIRSSCLLQCHAIEISAAPDSQQAGQSSHHQEMEEAQGQAEEGLEPSHQKLLFTFSMMDDEHEVEPYYQALQQLGINWSHTPLYCVGTTHVLVPALCRTERLLAGMAAGNFIVLKDYVIDSAQAGKLLPTDKYEVCKDPYNSVAASAPEHWRLQLELTKLCAFKPARVVLVLKSFTDDRAAWFLAILKAGAASVVTTEAALEFGADMAVFGPELPFAESTYTDLRAKQVLCVKADFVINYLAFPGKSLLQYVLPGAWQIQGCPWLQHQHARGIFELPSEYR